MINPQEEKIKELYEAIKETPYSVAKTGNKMLRIGFNRAFKELVS